MRCFPAQGIRKKIRLKMRGNTSGAVPGGQPVAFHFRFRGGGGVPGTGDQGPCAVLRGDRDPGRRFRRVGLGVAWVVGFKQLLHSGPKGSTARRAAGAGLGAFFPSH